RACSGLLRLDVRLHVGVRVVRDLAPRPLLLLRNDEAPMSKSSRRQFMQHLAVGLGAAAGGGVGGARKAHGGGGAPMNVLFVSIDDLNDFPAPFGGYPGIHTPYMSQLAAQSVVFQKAYCAGPYCGASRSATMTGAAPWRTGIIDNINIMDPMLLPGAL